MEFAKEVITLGPKQALARFPPSLQDLPFGKSIVQNEEMKYFENDHKLIAAMYVYIKAEQTLSSFDPIDTKEADDQAIRDFFIENGWITGEGKYDRRLDISNDILQKICQIFVEIGWLDFSLLHGKKLDVLKWDLTFVTKDRKQRNTLPREADIARCLSMSLKVTARAVGLTYLFHDFRGTKLDPKIIFRERAKTICDLVPVMRQQIVPLRRALYETMKTIAKKHDLVRHPRFKWTKVPLDYGLFVMNTETLGWEKVEMPETIESKSRAALWLYNEIPILQDKAKIILKKLKGDDKTETRFAGNPSKYQLLCVLLVYMLPVFTPPSIVPIGGCSNKGYNHALRTWDKKSPKRTNTDALHNSRYVAITQEINLRFLDIKRDFIRLRSLTERCYMGAGLDELYQFGVELGTKFCDVKLDKSNTFTM